MVLAIYVFVLCCIYALRESVLSIEYFFGMYTYVVNFYYLLWYFFTQKLKARKRLKEEKTFVAPNFVARAFAKKLSFEKRDFFSGKNYLCFGGRTVKKPCLYLYV